MSKQVKKAWSLDFNDPWQRAMIIGLGAIMTLYSAVRLLKLWKKPASEQLTLFGLHQIREKVMNGLKNAPIVTLSPEEVTRKQGLKYSLDIALTKTLSNKQSFNPVQKNKNPFLPPFEQGIYISELDPSHRLLYNKYAAMKGHVLIISKEFQFQNSKLNYEDLKQTVFVTSALKGFYFYNSGKDSGGSQPHKHLQSVSNQNKKLPILQKLQMYCKNKIEKDQIQKPIKCELFSFQHGLVIFENDYSLDQLTNATYRAYLQLYNKLIKSKSQKNSLSYNLLGTQRFLLMVPRKKEHTLANISLNGLGFAGSVMTKTKDQYYEVLNHTPEDILQQITFKDSLELQRQRDKTYNDKL